MGRVLNKSTWARKGVDASMTTNVEPGWKGFLTIELHYKGWKPLTIPAGVGIAQVIFETIEVPVVYDGKYQNQEDRPVEARG
ncbi:deoxycytidine triphosphate deaminase [Burkholderia phage vB_BpP_HN04]